MSDEERFDGMLFNLAGQHPGGIFEVLDTLFSFLARKTDFYHGGPKGQAQATLLEKFKKYEKLALVKHQKEVEEREEQDRIRKEKLKKKREEEEKANAKIVEIDDAEAEKIQAEIEMKKQKKDVRVDDVVVEKNDGDEKKVRL